MSLRTSSRLIAAALVCGLGASQAAAQEAATEILPEALETTEAVEVMPWRYRLNLGAGLNFAASNNVVGASDGATWTISLNVDAGAYYIRGSHEWRNSLLISEAFTRTPTIDEFLKSADALNLESLYLYHLPNAPWFGPFGRFTLETSIFAGRDVRSEPTTYLVTREDGTVDTVVATANSIHLTSPFQPLSLSESIGVFLEPVAETEISYELMVGLGARQTFAGGGLAVSDDDTTGEIEVATLEDSTQVGAAAITKLYGELEEGRVSYQLGGEVLIPFINDLPEDDDRGAIDLTLIRAYLGLSFRLVEWASLDYRFDARREPLVVEEWQTQHNLLLTFTYSFIDQIAEE